MSLQVTVTGNIGEYTLGQVLQTNAEIADYFRQGFQLSEERELDLSDEKILATLASVPQEGKELEDWEVEVIELLASGGVDEDEEVQEVDASMAGLLAKADKDKPLANLISGAVDGQEKVDSSPAHIAARFQVIYTKEEQSMFPIVGSKIEDMAGSNRLPDVYSTRRQNSNGEWTEVKGSRIRDFVTSHHLVKNEQARIDAVKASVPEGVKLNVQQAGEVKRLNARKSSATRQLTRGIRVMQQLAVFESHKHVDAQLVYDTVTDPKTGKDVQVLSKGKYPVVLINRHRQTEGNNISVSTFIALKPTSEMKLGDVLKSARRKPRPKVSAVKVDSKTFPDVIAATVNALDSAGTWSVIVTSLAETNDTNDHVLLSLARLEQQIPDLIDRHRKRIGELHSAQKRKEAAELAAKGQAA